MTDPVPAAMDAGVDAVQSRGKVAPNGVKADGSAGSGFDGAPAGASDVAGEAVDASDGD